MRQTRQVLNSPRLSELKKQRQQKKMLRRSLILILLLILCAALVVLARNEKVNINSVKVMGNKVVDPEAVRGVAERELEGFYFWLLPKTNFLIYPQSSIERALAAEFPRFKTVSIGIRKPQTLEIQLLEREPRYTWCGAEPSANPPSCYFLDEEGYIFDQAPYFSGEVYFRFYGETATNPVNSYFLEDNFKELINFKENIATIGLEPVALYNYGTDREMFLSAVSQKEKPKIIFKASEDYTKITENLEAALRTEPLMTDFIKKYSSLQYIDLRFANKVYYKFR